MSDETLAVYWDKDVSNIVKLEVKDIFESGDKVYICVNTAAYGTSVNYRVDIREYTYV